MLTPSRWLPGGGVRDNVVELCLYELTVEVRYLVLEGVLEALQTLTFVATSLEPSAQDWNTLGRDENNESQQACKILHYR